MLRSRENESSAIALYIRLARVLREQISQGHWRPGDRLPTVEQLSSERGVSRVTVRQAVALLVKEGLLLSSRGRGIVVARTAFLPIDDPGLRLAINDRYGLAAGQRIRVLSRGRCKNLPPELSLEIGVTTGFSRIRKVHFHNGLPFAYLDSYVPQEIYDLFPRGSDKKLKIQRLIRDAGIDIHVARQEVTLTHATPEVAALLDCAMGAALVRLRSWRFDKSGRIVYAAANLYRGDLFVLDFVEEQSDRKPLPWLTPLTRYR